MNISLDDCENDGSLGCGSVSLKEGQAEVESLVEGVGCEKDLGQEVLLGGVEVSDDSHCLGETLKDDGLCIDSLVEAGLGCGLCFLNLSLYDNVDKCVHVCAHCNSSNLFRL